MPYLRVSIAVWKVDVQSAEGQAIIQKVRDEAVPMLRRLPGFVRFQGAIAGPRATTTVMEWDSEAHAQAGLQPFCVRLQSSGIRQQLESLDAYLGEVIVST